MQNWIKKIIVGLVALVSFAAVSFAASVNLTNGVAIEGHDPVAYFTQSAAVKGSSDFTAKHGGATYQFSSAKNKELFLSAPAKYAPQYGSFCAYAVSKGYTAAVEPEQFSVVDGKLYLNYNAKVRSIWSKDKAGFISRADKNWPNVK